MKEAGVGGGEKGKEEGRSETGRGRWGKTHPVDLAVN